ncbi:hypothetical protein RPMA_10900 [Tardiphaga alba]|uniref:Terminase small subunit n=1 Tax=Tardiphaga alba TaxID=340268 RepID=A0ABX8A764_9BRAD|nr:hypothetical protein [Tardiphaga alba]QUS39287.1 hypothetical protein RPMA_10900 [Tardiphaga alba]
MSGGTPKWRSTRRLLGNMMPSPSYAKRAMRGFTPEAVLHLRHRYEETDEKVSSIAADFGVHAKTINTLAHKEGWKLRKDRPPRDLPPAIRLTMEANQAIGGTKLADTQPVLDEITAAAEAPAVSSAIASRLEAALEKELRKLEALRSEFGPVTHRSIEAERIARTLATLTEVLFKVRRLREPAQGGVLTDDDLPTDIDGFRRALAERMDAFVRSRDDGGVPADAGGTDTATA